MSTPARLAASPLRLIPRKPSSPRRGFAASAPSPDEQFPQRTPLGDYYINILRDPVPYQSHKPARGPSTARSSRRQEHTRVGNPEAEPRPPSPRERARIVFGSRLLGPAEQADSLSVKQARSKTVAGVLVPPRPEEPDNCCMSGCVNCVWDRYREDMEEWTARKKEARLRLDAGSAAADADDAGPGTPSGKTTANEVWDDEAVYKGVPVGIREFMKQEKRLKEKHAREGTIGG
ncbi:uncharacterized protein UV8b_00801 [Ustilaginoidea virens]|uniref:Oxidoreductase-like domain-containing protein n=1 Tax=Ustilaginoidea virens TaxID=1159556 RepID=A0A063BT31_USTVR|nr:uncharacterized protein UV8b_00801 [Ustilaginoidea virens]QUC16560.1 hypothetical protein UV8b_00801 [Ustilaginoidea virens]GAO16639.1 hypothetical protein UVI_02012600 [Ustilaginoidea virens]